MKIGIHRDIYKKTNDKIDRYIKIIEHNGYEAILMDVSEPDFWNKLKELDYFIFRYSIYDDQKQIANSILPVIENYYEIPVFPDQNTCWSYDDKVKEAFMLGHPEIPFAETKVFFDKKEALNYAKTAEYPLIFKLRGGSQSRNVVLVKKRRELEKIIRQMFGKGIFSDKVTFNGNTQEVDFSLKKIIRKYGSRVKRFINGEDANLYWNVQKNYVFLQKFYPGNNFDTRVTTIGSRAFAVRRKTREGDFRASGSNMLYKGKNYDMDMIKIALEISKKYKFQTMAYDFIYDEHDQPKILEISYNYPDYSIDQAAGYWDENLKYHEGRNCPEYFHLIDLLGKPDLKVPEIELQDPTKLFKEYNK